MNRKGKNNLIQMKIMILLLCKYQNMYQEEPVFYIKDHIFSCKFANDK